jgi:hypothetical protein
VHRHRTQPTRSLNWSDCGGSIAAGSTLQLGELLSVPRPAEMIYCLPCFAEQVKNDRVIVGEHALFPCALAGELRAY